jgi:zinc transporter ZupT
MPSDPALFWTKIGFVFFSFFEAFLTGLIPTWSKSCRESPKVLGIANSFAAGVFMGIAFVHILPEMTTEWNEHVNPDPLAEQKKVFPVPNILVVAGYTFILIIDKVLFDTHSLFAHDDEHGDGHGHGESEDDHGIDPAEKKFRDNLRASYA